MGALIRVESGANGRSAWGRRAIKQCELWMQKWMQRAIVDAAADAASLRRVVAVLVGREREREREREG